MSSAFLAQNDDTGASPAGAATVRTLLCSDVEGFTAMLQRLGDDAALAVMKRHDTVVRTLVAEHGGTVLELRGDGFLISFLEPSPAVRCATAIQSALARDRERRPDGGVHVRMGVHTGRMLIDGERYFGLDVVVPFRLLEQARSGEILISEQARAALREESRITASETAEFDLKGIRDRVRATRFYPLAGQGAVVAPA